MINSVDPGQLASKEKPTDLDLYCLQRQGISMFSGTRVNPKEELILFQGRKLYQNCFCFLKMIYSKKKEFGEQILSFK